MLEQLLQQAINWGPPALILAIALYVVYKGAFVTKGSVDSIKAAYDLLVQTKNEQLVYREALIAELKAQNQAQDAKLDKALDTLESAIKMVEAGPQLPQNHAQTQQRGVRGSGR